MKIGTAGNTTTSLSSGLGFLYIEKFVLTHIKSLIFQNQTRLDKLKQRQRQPLTKWQRVEVEGPAPPSEIVAKYEEMF